MGKEELGWISDVLTLMFSGAAIACLVMALVNLEFRMSGEDDARRNRFLMRAAIYLGIAVCVRITMMN